jgi:AcrR family transcriptional regulator
MNMGSNSAAKKPMAVLEAAGGGRGKQGGARPAVWGELPNNWEHRRDAILRRVANMLRESRLSTFTLADVANELGMTKGNIYYYFKDKQDLIYQCHMRSMELSLRALKSSIDENLSPSEQMHSLLRRHIAAVVEEGFGGILQTDLDNLKPEQRDSYVAKRDEFERGFRGILQAGVESGDFVCPNVKLAGFAILGAINWIPKWFNPKGPFTAEQISEQIADQLLNGLLPKYPNTTGNDNNL